MEEDDDIDVMPIDPKILAYMNRMYQQLSQFISQGALDPMPRATVIHDTQLGTYDIKFPHDRDLVATIKTVVPASDRSWNPETKTWTIDEKYWDIFSHAMKAKSLHYAIETKAVPDSEYINNFFHEDPGTPQVESKESIAAKLETLLTVSVVNTPFDELKKAYRRKALELHPDRNNGDGSKMSELNALWSVFNSK